MKEELEAFKCFTCDSIFFMVAANNRRVYCAKCNRLVGTLTEAIVNKLSTEKQDNCG